MNDKILIKNVSEWTQEIHNPRYVEFPPGQIVEIEHSIGVELAKQPGFKIVEPMEPSKNVKKKEAKK